MRRIILVASAVAALLLGLEKIGVFHLLPPGDVNFRSSTERLPDGREALVMTSDAGDLSCWLQVVVRVEGQTTQDFQASIASGEQIVVDVDVSGGPRRSLAISKAPNASLREPFLWRSGLPIRLTPSAPGGKLTLEDWVVHSSAQPSDSRDKSWWRTRWTWASWILLALAVLGAAVTAWPRTEPVLGTGHALVKAIVESVTSSSPEQSARLRTFLRQVLLESVGVQEALDGLAIPSSPAWVRAQFVARARSVFLARIAAVKAELDAYGNRLA
jgi:hypothetical protein